MHEAQKVQHCSTLLIRIPILPSLYYRERNYGGFSKHGRYPKVLRYRAHAIWSSSSAFFQSCNFFYLFEDGLENPNRIPDRAFSGVVDRMFLLSSKNTPPFPHLSMTYETMTKENATGRIHLQNRRILTHHRKGCYDVPAHTKYPPFTMLLTKKANATSGLSPQPIKSKRPYSTLCAHQNLPIIR